MYKIKPTPCITDDADTICFMKYFLHNWVKQNLIKELKYEEIFEVKDLIEEFADFEPLIGRQNVTQT